jgi:O-antigen/teichoic acid export membrane protein
LAQEAIASKEMLSDESHLRTEWVRYRRTLRGKVIRISRQLARVLALFRLRPFDTESEGGRSKERYRRAAMTTVSMGAAKAIGMMASLITVPLTYGYLGQERYGLWMVLISIVMLVMGVADLGIGNGLVNALSEANGKDDHDMARECVTSAFVIMFCIGGVFAAVGTVAYPFVPWMRLYNVQSETLAAEGARAFLVLYFGFVVGIPLSVISRAQTGMQQGYFPQIVGAFGSIFTLAAFLVVIKLHGSLVWLVFASMIGGILAQLVNGWFLFRKYTWLLPSWDAYRASSAIKILKLGLLFFVLQTAAMVGFTSDNIVIAQVLGAAAVAAYAVPQKLFNVVSMLVSMAIGPLWPAYGEAIARGDAAWVRRVFSGSLWLILGMTIPTYTLLVLAGPWILRVAFGKSLHAPTSLLVVFGIWGVVYSLIWVTTILLNAAGVLKVQSVVVVFASVANLALSILLTHRFGAVGVCLGSIITQVLITLPINFVLIRGLFKKLGNAKLEGGLHDAACSA